MGQTLLHLLVKASSNKEAKEKAEKFLNIHSESFAFHDFENTSRLEEYHDLEKLITIVKERKENIKKMKPYADTIDNNLSKHPNASKISIKDGLTTITLEWRDIEDWKIHRKDEFCEDSIIFNIDKKTHKVKSVLENPSGWFVADFYLKW